MGKRTGRPRGRPRSEATARFQVRLPPDIHKLYVSLASSVGLPYSVLMREVLIQSAPYIPILVRSIDYLKGGDNQLAEQIIVDQVNQFQTEFKAQFQEVTGDTQVNTGSKV